MFYIRGHIVRLLDSNSVFSALNFRSHQEMFICSLSSKIGNAFKKQPTFKSAEFKYIESGLSVINCHVCLERSLEDVC